MSVQPLGAVCLDAFGTLVRIIDRRGPYRDLFRLLGAEPRRATHLAMTSNLSLQELAGLLAPAHDVDLAGVIEDLEAETASVSLFDETAGSLRRLRRLGLKLWVASNLAPPYATPLRALLSGLVDGFCLSFEVGAMKPEPAFYERLCSSLGCPPGQALMVGDSPRADVEGAKGYGLRATHLNRAATDAGPDRVCSLAELADRLERAASG